jgi:hypothetical protein
MEVARIMLCGCERASFISFMYIDDAVRCILWKKKCRQRIGIVFPVSLIYHNIVFAFKNVEGCIVELSSNYRQTIIELSSTHITGRAHTASCHWLQTSF